MITAGSPQQVPRANLPAIADPAKAKTPCQPVTAMLGKGLAFAVGSRTVSFGDSPQDVCSALGNPSSTVQRPADPGGRWKNQKQPLALDYFYNYADRCNAHHWKKGSSENI